MFRNWYNWVDVCIHYDEPSNRTYLLQCRTRTNGLKKFRRTLVTKNKLSEENTNAIIAKDAGK